MIIEKEMKRVDRKMLILLAISLAVTLLLEIPFGGLRANVSRDFIELLITLSITTAGFGLVAFQIGKGSKELKKEFVEFSIMMIISSFFGIFFLAYPSLSVLSQNLGEISVLLFLWSFLLFLIILLNERFSIIK